MIKKAKSDLQETLSRAAIDLSESVDRLSFDDPVTHVYNPLAYARDAHLQYLSLAGAKTSVVFLGMNPGPWGMAQTGVPFGEIAAVRDWMKINATIDKPSVEHPKRPVEGFDCEKSEVSGRRLWGLMQTRFGSASKFFRNHFVLNYCPLVFMEQSARNRTPDKLPAAERAPLDAVCDQHLQTVLACIQPRHVVGVGVYAEACLKRAVADIHLDTAVTRILHPSPASPAANKDWSGKVTAQLIKAGVWKDE